jgi:anti-sigma B factor antagonist
VGPASSRATGGATIVPHAVTQSLDDVENVLRDATLAPPPRDLASWTTLISIAGQPALLVRESPARQVCVAFQSESLSRSPQFVYLWTNILDWAGGSATNALIARPIESPGPPAPSKPEPRQSQTRPLTIPMLLDTPAPRLYCLRLCPQGLSRAKPIACGTFASSPPAGTPPMAESLARLNVIAHKDVSVVEFTENKILDELSIAEIGQALTGLAQAKDRPKILLDFSNVDHLTSAALGMLINVNNRVREHNGQLRLSNIKPQIMEVFVITKLSRLFKILPTRAEALSSFE